ncbi:MAG: flagellar assembly protein FliX, partial [Pseudomonadota bacterium]
MIPVNRINQSKLPQFARKTKSAKPQAPAKRFAKFVDDQQTDQLSEESSNEPIQETASQASPISDLSTIDPILFAQERALVSQQEKQERQARHWSVDIIDELNKMRIDLLRDDLTDERLKAITVKISERKNLNLNPNL